MSFRHSLPRFCVPAALALALAQGSAVAAGPAPALPEAGHVHQEAAAALLAARHHLVSEALAANEDILLAIASLDHNDTKDAYRVLADASGKLDLVLARDPHLKRVPVSARLSITDFSAKISDVKQAIADARKALSDHHVQDAKALLHPLASEMRITVQYVPLDTFPAQIKAASQEIQAGKTQAAAQRLADTLSAVVTEEQVIPLPPMKAEADVQQAEALVKADPAKNKAQALALLGQAKEQLEMGKLLGYGSFEDIRKEMDAVKTKITGGSWDGKLFDRLKSLLHEAHAKLT